MFARVVDYRECEEKYVDHYIKLLIDNSEIVALLKKHNALKEVIYRPFDFGGCMPTREYRYHDKWGNYWDNWIGKEIIIDL